MENRLIALDLDDFTVVLAPGPLGDFEIQTISTASNELRRLTERGVVNDSSRNIESLEKIRILTVPADDGSTPLWHPIVLGHELAHLKYTPQFIEQWLARSPVDGLNDLGRDVIAMAGERESNPARAVPYPWFQSLTYWLSEIACDSALAHQYGEEGVGALAVHLAVYSLDSDTSSHPNPKLRVSIQADANDLSEYVPQVPSADESSKRRSAAIIFARKCRAMVAEDIAGSLTETGDEGDQSAFEAAFLSLRSNSIPPSQHWSRAALKSRPNSIESGLVRALWKRRLDRLESVVPSNSDIDALLDVERDLQDLRHIEHAVDVLQFAARFERARSLYSEVRDDKIASVLYVSSDGVKILRDGVGAPACDLRLGRFFIVFKRNEIASLNSVGGSADARSIQTEVQVGWGQSFVLHPGELVLAVSLERVELTETCSAQVLSRSSLGRLGLLSATAVHIQPGYAGCLTLELVNLASVPLRLFPGQRIAQIVPSVATAQGSYSGHYQSSGSRPMFSAASRDWESQLISDL